MPARPNRPPHGNFSQLNHDFIEQIMRDLSLSETRVYLSIYRLTIGFQRQVVTVDRDTICEWSQINVATFHRAVNSLIERGLIAKSPNGGGRAASYSIMFDSRAHATVDSDPQSHPCDGDSRTHATVNPDPVLIDSSLKEKIKEIDNPPTPFELDRPIDKWAEDAARNLGLKLRINTAKKRTALRERDGPEFRSELWGWLQAIAETEATEATDEIMRRLGHATSTHRSGGMSRQSLGASHARSYAPATNQTKVDTALQETPLAQEIRDCRSAADLTPRIGDFINMPAWKVAVLDALRLRDKNGFRERLTATFANLADDYRQGVTTDAIVESFFATEQQRAKQNKGGFDDIREYIDSLSA